MLEVVYGVDGRAIQRDVLAELDLIEEGNGGLCEVGGSSLGLFVVQNRLTNGD